MKASLLTIGDELLIGQVLNSNAQWVSQQLTDLGIEVTTHLTVGDDRSAIHAALDTLLSKSEIIVIGGGLGPTHDDITLEVLSEYFRMPLSEDAEWLAVVENLFRIRNRVMTENNKKQALLMTGAERIDNDCGTAAGQCFTSGKTEIFVVPGVPHEVKSMMTRFILPRLASRALNQGEKIRKTTLLTTGMGESALASRLDPFVRKIKTIPGLTLAFLPNLATVRLRLQMRTRSPADEDLFETLVDELKIGCGKDYFGIEPETLEEIVLARMREQGRSLSIAESCTGGLIAHRLTQVPGASKVLKGALIAYQEEVKTLELGITASEIVKNGVVSGATAKAMAQGIRAKWGSDFGLATTGWLGPGGGDAFAGIGTVWIALDSESGTEAREFKYESNRERSKERAAQSAIDFLRRHLH